MELKPRFTGWKWDGTLTTEPRLQRKPVCTVCGVGRCFAGCNTVKKRFHNMPSSCERAPCVWKAAGAGFSLLSSGSGSFGGDSLLQVVSELCGTTDGWRLCSGSVFCEGELNQTDSGRINEYDIIIHTERPPSKLALPLPLMPHSHILGVLKQFYNGWMHFLTSTGISSL